MYNGKKICPLYDEILRGASGAKGRVRYRSGEKKNVAPIDETRVGIKKTKQFIIKRKRISDFCFST